jgi:hypothetical protein
MCVFSCLVLSSSPSHATSAAKGPQGQRDDIARIQQKLSNASGPVSTLADRMGANPWSKPAAAAGNSAPAIGTPRQPQAAAEPQRKPLVLAPRTQPLPVLPVQAQLAAAAVTSHAALTPSSEPSNSSSSQPPVPSKPKSDPFGGARPIDESKAAEIRRKLQEEKVAGPRCAHDVFILHELAPRCRFKRKRLRRVVCLTPRFPTRLRTRTPRGNMYRNTAPLHQRARPF